MVSISEVKRDNAALRTAEPGPIAAFVGGTSGIGLSTLHALLQNADSPTVYIVGRDRARLDTLIAEMQAINKKATINPIIAKDLTLVRDAQKAADEIASKAPRLDLLVMSPGYLSFASSPDLSPEGLDRVTSVRFQSRMRFLVTLLPVLQLAPSPRVISILAGGKEGQLDVSDLGMKNPKTYSFNYANGAAASMTTLFFEHVSKQPGNEKIVFNHIFPGIVNTPLKVQAGFLGTLAWNWIVRPLIKIMGSSSAEVGQRVLFTGTSGRFRRLQPGESIEGKLLQKGSDGTPGSGVYLVDADSSVVKEGGNKDLKKLRNEGAAAKVFEYTVGEFERIANL